jgi:hypothetical protein
MEDLHRNYVKAFQFAFRQALVDGMSLRMLRHRLRARPQPASVVRNEILAFLGAKPGNPHLSREVVDWLFAADVNEVSDYTLLAIASTELPPTRDEANGGD